METVSIDHIELTLSPPDTMPVEWVGREGLIEQLLAAWLMVDARDIPLNPRITGRPGIGKTTLAYAAAKRGGLEAYIYQGTVDTRPEDLLVTPVISSEGKIAYVASPILTAVIKGGVAILDEGNRMSEKSWASLASLLDARRYVKSIVAGIKVEAHPNFRFVTTMNEDASTFDIPDYIHSRLKPTVALEFGTREEEESILRANLPFGPEETLNYVADFLTRSHRDEQPWTVREGINIVRYAMKLQKQLGGEVNQHIAQAVMQVVGAEAVDYLHGRQKRSPRASELDDLLSELEEMDESGDDDET
jgi:MoxR-like ATPase